MYLIQLIDIKLAGLFAFGAHSSSIWGYVVRKETHKVLYDDYDYDYEYDDDDDEDYKRIQNSYNIYSVRFLMASSMFCNVNKWLLGKSGRLKT